MDIIVGIDIETTAKKLFEALTTASGIAAGSTPRR
jgi:hypothetical protein